MLVLGTYSLYFQASGFPKFTQVAPGHPPPPLLTCRPEIFEFPCFLVLVYSCAWERHSWIDLALLHFPSYVAQAALHRALYHARLTPFEGEREVGFEKFYDDPGRSHQ